MLQTSLRSLFGWRNAQDYWFPDIRSLGGAIFVMSAVLYPYVYITARASFLAQSVCVLEVSRTLGRTAPATFWEVALPLARPALAAGVALALMETLNDIGAVEFFGVKTLTVAVYDTWLDRNSLAGAAQIACIMLAFVFAVLGIERALRAGRRFHHTTGRYRHLPEDSLRGASGALAFLACALPLLFGFLIPASVLVRNAVVHVAAGLAPEFWRAAVNSLLLSAAAACLAVVFAVALGYARRQTRSKLIHVLSAVPAISYAVPGTVLAIGLLIPARRPRQRHRYPDALAVRPADRSPAVGKRLRSGARLHHPLPRRVLRRRGSRLEQDLAQHRCRGADARRHGQRDLVAGASAAVAPGAWRRRAARLRRFHEGAAGDVAARPFNFDTLATQVFTLASLYRYEEAGLSALTIVVASLAPVLLLHGMIVAGRPGALCWAGARRGCRSRGRGLWPFDNPVKSDSPGSLSAANRAKRAGALGVQRKGDATPCWRAFFAG